MKIKTVRDAVIQNRVAKEVAILRAARKAEIADLRAKIRRWERKADKYEGEMHRSTLARLRGQLLALVYADLVQKINVRE